MGGRTLELDDFYDLTQITDLAVSPTGDRVAFVAEEFDPDEEERRSSVFVVPTDGSREPHRLTRVSDAGSPTWSPDGSKLGFLAAREEDVSLSVGRGEPKADEEDSEEDEGGDGSRSNGDDEPKSQVWIFDLERGGDARQVTDRDEGVREFDFAPDGERIAISARDPTEEEEEYLRQRREEDGPIEVERLQHKADGVGWLDSVTTYLFVVDLDTRETERLDEAYGSGAREPLFGLQPAWGEGGIAFLSNRTENPDDSGVMDVYVIDPDGSNLRRITDQTMRATAPEWGPDGERLAFVAGNHLNWYEPAEVYVADPDGTYRSVSPDIDRTVAAFGGPRWLDGGALVCPFADEGWTRLVRLDADGGEGAERVFEGQGRDRTLNFFDLDGGTVAFTLSDPTTGDDVYALDGGDLDATHDDPLRRLTAVNDELLSAVDLPECRRVEYENGDGEAIEAIVYLPDGFEPDTDGTLPLITKIHGGPMSYDAPDFRFDHTYWTGQGYAVLRPNYRGSTSYGRAFAEQLKGTRGELESDDVRSGARDLVERGWADPDELYVTGFSYGGITTAHVLTRTDEFTAAAAEHGIYDFYAAFGTDDNHLWAEWEFGLPWENEETYREISSLTDVGGIDTPLLVTAGEEDWRCPPTQSEQLYVSVRKQGVDAKLIVYTDEHHDVDDPDRAIHRMRSLTEWFEEHAPDTGA